MNYQKLFDAIAFIVIAMCVIVGFITPLYLYGIAPNSKEISIQLLPGEIPPNAIRVFDVKDIEVVGEPKQVFGTYDFHGCNQTYVSASLNRKKEIVEFSVRGMTRNETFDYRFHRNTPYAHEDTVTYNVNDILSFNSENVVMGYYKTDLSVIASLIVGVVFAIILGGISYLITRGLEKILKSNSVQGMYREAKRFTSRGKKE